MDAPEIISPVTRIDFYDNQIQRLYPSYLILLFYTELQHVIDIFLGKSLVMSTRDFDLTFFLKSFNSSKI